MQRNMEIAMSHEGKWKWEAVHQNINPGDMAVSFLIAFKVEE